MRTRCLRSLLGMMILCVAFAVMGCGKEEKKEEAAPSPSIIVPDENEPTVDPDETDPDASPTPTEYPKREGVLYGSDEKLYSMYEQAADIGARYRVKIYIADLVPDEVLDFIRAERQMNSYRIYKALTALEDVLKYYPEDFFGGVDYAENDFAFNIYIVSNSPNFYSAIMCYDYDEEGNGWEGMVMQGEEQEEWDEYYWRFPFCLMYDFCQGFDYFSVADPSMTIYREDTWMSLQPEGFKYLGEGADDDKCKEYAENYPDHFRYEWEVRDTVSDRSYIFADLFWCMKNARVVEMPAPYLRKMGYLLDCIRDFSTRSDGWPEYTTWEAMYVRLCEKSGVQPGWK